MTARIYSPAKSATQQGQAKTRFWFLEYEPERPREVEPLMGWTASGDMKQQLRLRFDTLDEAVSYCERNHIPYRIEPQSRPARRIMAYSDNFKSGRIGQWTH
ncbi:MAG: ETC complex I subunit [Rhizobiales bacterium]|nr:ETC complex I subunit [Hyphomicrobiales bacterium]